MNSGVKPQPNEETVRRFAAGDDDAFMELHRSYVNRVQAFFVSSSTSRHVADDLSQDLWMRVRKNRSSFAKATLAEFYSWISKTASRMIIDVGRSIQRRGRNPGLDAISDPVQPTESQNSLERQEELTKVSNAAVQCMDENPTRAVEVFRRIYIDGASVEEAAMAFGTNANNVYKYVFRARQDIQACVKKKLQ